MRKRALKSEPNEDGKVEVRRSKLGKERDEPLYIFRINVQDFKLLDHAIESGLIQIC